MKRICLTTLVFLGLTALLSAQILKIEDAPEQAAKPVTPGDITPTFWIGGQAIAVVGKNLDTGVSGIGYSTDDTWLSFNVAFLDSHYSTPTKVQSKDDPNQWSVSFKLYGFTERLNSYSSSPGERNYPNWGLGVQGYGWHVGFLTQANQDNGANTGGDSGNKASTTLTGANEVLYLGQGTAGDSPFLVGDDGVVTTTYTGLSGSGYLGYEVPNLVKAYVTGGTRASDASTSSATQNAYAGVANVVVTPLGPGSYDEPLTFTLKGDAIAGTGFTKVQGGNPVGFGAQGQVDYYFDDDVVLSPLAAFDGRVNDSLSLSTGASNFEWKAGGGLQLALSQRQWVTDAYKELPSQGTGTEIFESSKILKYTYFQVVTDYARSSLTQKNKDVDLVFKAEEPDGIVGINDNLGAMAEYRVSNLTLANTGSKLTWSTIGRLSYDLAGHTVTPYVHWYFDSTQVAKVRVGVQTIPLKGTAVEVNYMSSNLNSAGGKTDPGRIEVLLGIATDTSFTMPKTMSFN
jgi:hypothetical protein